MPVNVTSSGYAITDDFQLSQNSFQTQQLPSIAALPNGNFITVWTDVDSFNEPGIRARIYDGNGRPVGAEFQVPASAAAYQVDPSVTVLANGGFVISWSEEAPYPAVADIKAQVFDGLGQKVGSEFIVNTTIVGFQTDSQVIGLTGGGFAVIWGQAEDATFDHIRGQVYAADGTRVGGEFVVNDSRGGDKLAPTVAALSDGRFIVSWLDFESDGQNLSYGTQAQIINADGSKSGAQFNLNNIAPGTQTHSALAGLPGGGFIGAWVDAGNGNAASKGVWAQAFDSAGNRIGSAQLITSTASTSPLSLEYVAGKGVLLTWTSVSGEIGILAGQFLDTSAMKIGDGFQLGDSRNSTKQLHDIAVLADGQIVFTWQDRPAPGADLDARAQILFPMTNGTAGNDVFNGTADRDFYDGLGGNDTIRGLAEDDGLFGGGGNDKLVGGAGRDTLNGGDDDDVLFSAEEHVGFPDNLFPNGNVTFDTGAEADTLDGGAGSDNLFAGFNDNVQGGADGVWGDLLYLSVLGASSGVTMDFRQTSVANGTGTIEGIESVIRLQGSNYDDDFTIVTNSSAARSSVVYAMGGNDRVIGAVYSTYIFGGDGNDYLDGRLSTQFLERIEGGDGDDTILASGTAGVLFGGAGNDTIEGGLAAYGGDGNDTIRVAGAFSGMAWGGAGDDTLHGGTYWPNTLIGGSGADHIDGGHGDDLLYSAGSDNGGSQSAANEPDTGTEHDRLSGLSGSDVISIGYGDDADGGTETDTLALSLLGASGGVTVDMADLIGGDDYVIDGGTIRNFELVSTLWGSNFSDTLTLTAQSISMHVYGMGGDDTINGSSDADHIDGGTGGDMMTGGVGDDTYVVDDAGDIVTELVGEGADWVESSIDYSLGANIEKLTLTGGALVGTGNALANLIRGNAQANILSAGDGDDQLYGFDGDDILIGGAGADVLDGGSGSDTADYSTAALGMTVTLGLPIVGAMGTASDGDQLAGSIENVTGSIYWDELTGNMIGNMLKGGGGNDTLTGNGGADVLDGGAGADLMTGGTEDDIYYVDDAGDQVVEEANSGNRDEVRSSLSSMRLGDHVEMLTYIGTGSFFAIGNDQGNNIIATAGAGHTIYGMGGDDGITSGDGNDALYGDDGSDVIFAGGGNDLLEGGAGADILLGMAGDDTYHVDRAGEVFESANEGTDTVVAGFDYTLDANVENLTLIGAATRGTGNALDNVITGTQHENLLEGGAGNDTLIGGGALDVLRGGAGDDSYYVDSNGEVFENAGEGIDTVFADMAEQMYILDDNVENLTLVGTTFYGVGNELGNQLTGSASTNWLMGGGGSDRLNGMGGDDMLYGDGGSDTFVFGTASGVDTVADFRIGIDKLDLSAISFANFDAVLAATQDDGSGNSFIELGGGNRVVLTGVTKAQLTGADVVLTGGTGATVAFTFADAGADFAPADDAAPDLVLLGISPDDMLHSHMF